MSPVLLEAFPLDLCRLDDIARAIADMEQLESHPSWVSLSHSYQVEVAGKLRSHGLEEVLKELGYIPTGQCPIVPLRQFKAGWEEELQPKLEEARAALVASRGLEDEDTGDMSLDTATPMQLTRVELANRLAGNPNEAKALVGTLSCIGGKDLKLSKVHQWTADKDPEGMSWEPTDSTREIWAPTEAIIRSAIGQ